jgi:hypothetical protein
MSGGTGDCHAPFHGSPGVRFPRATRPWGGTRTSRCRNRGTARIRSASSPWATDTSKSGQCPPHRHIRCFLGEYYRDPKAHAFAMELLRVLQAKGVLGPDDVQRLTAGADQHRKELAHEFFRIDDIDSEL